MFAPSYLLRRTLIWSCSSTPVKTSAIRLSVHRWKGWKAAGSSRLKAPASKGSFASSLTGSRKLAGPSRFSSRGRDRLLTLKVEHILTRDYAYDAAVLFDEQSRRAF